MGRYVITMPAVSYARELWRYGEPDLAQQAARMIPSQCADVGERAGQLHISGAAADLWPDGPKGVISAILLAAVENLEGKARPCARSRRLPERSLPEEWRLTEEQRLKELAAVAREMDARLPSET